MRSYYHKGFIVTRGTCENHPKMWEVRDFRDYDEAVGSKATGICVRTLAEAWRDIDNLLFVEKNIPF